MGFQGRLTLETKERTLVSQWINWIEKRNSPCVLFSHIFVRTLFAHIQWHTARHMLELLNWEPFKADILLYVNDTMDTFLKDGTYTWPDVWLWPRSKPDRVQEQHSRVGLNVKWTKTTTFLLIDRCSQHDSRKHRRHFGWCSKNRGGGTRALYGENRHDVFKSMERT